MKFRVWFEQVNATYLDVDALDKEQATRLASADWKYNTQPVVTGCRKLNGSGK